MGSRGKLLTDTLPVVHAADGAEHARDVLRHPDLPLVSECHIGILPMLRQEGNPPGSAHMSKANLLGTA